MRLRFLQIIVAGVVLFVSIPVRAAGSGDETPDGMQGENPEEVAGKTYVRAYEIYDPRFCWLTPRPFICEKCLGAEEQFVQILRFDAEGVPFRSYQCLPWKRPYLDR